MGGIPLRANIILFKCFKKVLEIKLLVINFTL